MPESLTVPKDYFNGSQTKLVGNIWNHMLVNEQTFALREKAIADIEAYLDSYFVPRESYIACLTGSSIFVTTETSDADFVFILKSKVSKTVWDLMSGLDQPDRGNLSVADQMVPMMRTDQKGKRYFHLGKENLSFPALFFTPDNNIGGNIQWARGLRLMAIDRIEESFDIESHWDNDDSFIREYLRRFYTGWGRNTVEGWKNPGRRARIEERLVGTGSSVEDFYASLDAVSLPRFEEFARELRRNNGAILI